MFCALLSACGEDAESAGLFSKAQVEEVAAGFRAAVASGDASAVVRYCRAPFGFRTRNWNSEQELNAKINGLVGALRGEASGLDQYEVFSRRDLEEGRWPRGEAVPKGDRARRIEELGLAADGFLVRIHAERRTGWLLVLEPESGTRLILRALR